MKKLNIALVGCGHISIEHIQAYLKVPERASVRVCCDIDLAKATQRAAMVEGARAVVELDQVLNDPTIDAVDICTPHHLHSDTVIAAANSGKHIICQKPLAKTLSECDAMISAAERAGTVLYYGEMNQMLPSVTKAAEMVAENRIGKLVGVQGTFAFWQGGDILSTAWRYDPEVTGGGQLLDSGIHCIAMMLKIAGPIESVSCLTTRFRQELGGEDTSSLTFRFKAGHLGTLFASQAAGTWVPQPNLTIWGSEGALTLGGPLGALVLHRPDHKDRQEVVIADRTNAFDSMIGGFLDATLDGATNASPGEVGRENLQVVLAAYKSAKTGKVVRLDQTDDTE